MRRNRIIYIIALVLAFAACQKDNAVVDFSADIADYGDNGSKVHLEGRTEGEGENAVTKYWANWDNQDKVWINGVPKNITVTPQEVDGSTKNIAAISSVAVNVNGYYAVYPADNIVTPDPRTTIDPTSYSGGYPTILLPQVQIFDKVTVNGQTYQKINAPMAAYCDYNEDGRGHSLLFRNLCSLVEVNVPSGTEVAYINVTSDVYLWGNATITGGSNPSLNMTTTTPATDYYSSNKTVTLDCTTNGLEGSHTSTNNSINGAYGAQGETSVNKFYVVIPAGSYSTIKVDVYVFTGGYTTNSTMNRTIGLYTRSVSRTNPILKNNIYAVSFISDNLITENIDPYPYPGLGTGEFTVAKNGNIVKKVRISLGNLQYQASTGLWRFAENQWDYRGNNAGNTTETNRDSQSDWIDLFGYGTSGKGNPSYAPTLYQNSGQYGPNSGDDISGTVYDWGTNEISNGGNQPNKWRTLTREEWQYLTDANNSRSNLRHGKQGFVRLYLSNGSFVRGMMFVPDNYPYTDHTLTWSYNERKDITWNDWSNYFSKRGCIFIPSAGQRYGLSVTFGENSTEQCGYYWSSSSNGSNYAYMYKMKYYASTESADQVQCQSFERKYGLSVRLVRDVD